MADFILIRIIRFIGRKLDGYKTIFGGIGFIMTGVLGLIRLMFPDLTDLPEMSLEAIMASFAAGLTAIGVAGKAEKIIHKEEVK